LTEQSGFDFQSLADCLAGVDEVGRGPLAGPVVAAAVILDPERPIEGLVSDNMTCNIVISTECRVTDHGVQILFGLRV